jgi:FkbM family methyltransferase
MTNPYRERLSAVLSKGVCPVDAGEVTKRRPVLFGAGRLGQITRAGLRKTSLEPLAFADNNPRIWGSQVDGLEVISPDEAVRRFGADVPFVVTVYTGGVVRRQLRDRGLRVFSFAHLARALPEALLPHAAVDYPEKTAAQADAITRGLDVWADDRSREEYLGQVRYRLTLADDLPPFIPPAETYFPEELIARRADECFVDCGAFDGDSVRAFVERRGGAFARAIAIEADPLNAAKLRQSVAGMPEAVRKRIRVVESAVGSRRERVRFDSTGTAGSVIGGTGTIEVDCAPLDELLEGETPTYIKMDIEGAEPLALAGARRVIERHRPVLAICLYHSHEHLWEIPLFLHGVAPDYQLFLRRYSDDCWEQVCYAVPAGRVLPGATA